jgi:hypothetical protein
MLDEATNWQHMELQAADPLVSLANTRDRLMGRAQWNSKIEL